MIAGRQRGQATRGRGAAAGSGRDGDSTGAAHELVDHTSEVTMRLRAPSFAALIVEATRALGELVPASQRGAMAPHWRSFDVRAGDRAAVLVDWLNEVVYLCEVDLWLPTELDVDLLGDAELSIHARGVTLNSPFVLVKAATLHRARVREGEGAVEGEVTLDV